MGVKPIAAGDLRHRVAIQSRTQVRTAQGGFTYTWATVNTVWARIAPATGNEYFFSDEVRSKMTHFVKCRAQTAAVLPDMRLLYGTRIFNIVGVQRVDEVQHELNIAAVENVDLQG